MLESLHKPYKIRLCLYSSGEIMATYKEIQAHVKRVNEYIPKSCWIADVRHDYGLTTRKAPNRQGNKRKHPCPDKKRPDIVAALKALGDL